MSEGHSRFGGSIADRWMNCPGSVALCATVPELPSSKYAEEGTLAHALGEFALKNGYDNAAQAAADFSATVGPTIEMCDAVQVYLNAVYKELGAAKDAQLHVEQSFTYPGMDGEVYGRNDAIVYTPSLGRLVVFDYKHGVGVSVSAEDNAQLKFYAAGALLANPDWRATDIWLVIVQPRARDVEYVGAVKPWKMDVLEVLDFCSEIEMAVSRCKTPDAPLETGSWCRWCDAAAICPAREKEALAALGGQFEGIDMVDATALDEPHNMTGEQIAQVLRGIGVLNKWAAQVQEFAEAHMIAGTLEVPGWKVVAKLGRAKWIDADEAVANYLDLMYGFSADEVRPRKLETIGNIEKLMKSMGAKKGDIDTFKLRFTLKESSGVTIAPVGDRREAVNPAAQFDGVDISDA